VAKYYADAAARSVTCDRTHPVVLGALWNLSRPRPDAGTVASGHCVERVRSRGQQRESVATGRRGASDQF
jgi:hypothetical protein